MYLLNPLQIASQMRKHPLELVKYQNRNQREVILAPDLQRLAMQILPQCLAVTSLGVFGPAACEFLFEAARHLLQRIRGLIGEIDTQVDGQIMLIPKQWKQAGLQQRTLA